MIKIINKYTGELVAEYRAAAKCYCTPDSFIAPVKAAYRFRLRWGALIENYIVLNEGRHPATQCTLRDQYAVKGV